MSRLRRERKAARRDDQRSARRSLLHVAEGLLWVLVAGLFLWRIAPQARAAARGNAAGPEAPAVTLALLHGGNVPLARLKGQVVLVNFWATWCPPCRAEMPAFQQVYQARHPDGFTVVGVSMDDGAPPHVAAFLEDHAIGYPIAMATPETVAAFGGVNSLPTSFLIDRRGRVRYTVHGMFSEAALRTAVDRLLAEHG
jgi:cytochrome c biogenesis protein CcmG, thiol:disulfide interchange protein DsbE